MAEWRDGQAKVGVFGIGLAAYWPQFEGLLERLSRYQRDVEARISQWAGVISAGMVDTAPKAKAAGEQFSREGVDTPWPITTGGRAAGSTNAWAPD